MKKILLLLTVLVSFAACSKEGEVPALAGRQYKAVSESGVEITLEFHESEPRFSGKVGNRYFGAYKQDGVKIRFSQVASTMMMPLPNIAEVESEYFKFLEQVESAKQAGDNLILENADGQIWVFEPARD